MLFIKKISLVILIVGVVFQTKAQSDSTTNDSIGNSPLQFSGVIIDMITQEPVPYMAVYDKKSRRGTLSDAYGFFSIAAFKMDTLVFKRIGYKKSFYIIPDSLTDIYYSVIHQVIEDTVQLTEVSVYPWPSREQFKDAFVNTDIPNDDVTRALEHLSPEMLALKQGAYPASGQLNFLWQMQNYQTQIYYAGQSPPIQLLNPIAWAQFIKAWKNGEFKKKDK